MHLKNKSFINPNSPNDIPDPLCKQYNEKIYETVEHFLLKCNKFKDQRKIMIENILKDCNPYKSKLNLSINDLLFPYYNNLNKKKYINSFDLSLPFNAFNSLNPPSNQPIQSFYPKILNKNFISFDHILKIWNHIIIFINNSNRFKTLKKSEIIE